MGEIVRCAIFLEQSGGTPQYVWSSQLHDTAWPDSSSPYLNAVEAVERYI